MLNWFHQVYELNLRVYSFLFDINYKNATVFQLLFRQLFPSLNCQKTFVYLRRATVKINIYFCEKRVNSRIRYFSFFLNFFLTTFPKKAQCDTSYGQKADSPDHFHGSDFLLYCRRITFKCPVDLTPYVRITKSRKWKWGREAAPGRCRAFFFEEKKAQCDTPYGQKADSQDHFHGSDFVI